MLFNKLFKKIHKKDKKDDEDVDLLDYLNKILNLIDNIKSRGNDDFYLRIINVLMLYYLSLEEIKYIENMGLVIDDNYINTVCLPTYKMNVILGAWTRVENEEKKKNTNIIKFYKILVDSINNNSVGTEEQEISIDDKKYKIETGKTIDFITPGVVLELIEALINDYDKIIYEDSVNNKNDRMFINHDGKVGMGTTIPAIKLVV